MGKWHYVYMTINLKNNKKYIGKRTYKGNNILDDTYLGSGKILKKSIKKYGEKYFKKIIIAICKTEEDAYGYERTLIEQLGAVKSKQYYNLVEGHDLVIKVTADNVNIVMIDASTGRPIRRCGKKSRYSKVIRITNKINRMLNIREWY